MIIECTGPEALRRDLAWVARTTPIRRVAARSRMATNCEGLQQLAVPSATCAATYHGNLPGRQMPGSARSAAPEAEGRHSLMPAIVILPQDQTGRVLRTSAHLVVNHRPADPATSS